MERERAERRMARLAVQQTRRRRVQAGIAGSLALALLVLGTTWLLGGFTDDPDAPVTLPTCTWTQRQPGAGVAETGLPPAVVPTSGVRNLVITTNLGEIRATVDLGAAFCAAASVNHLALQGFYDGTRCHQLDTGLYTLTCGSKTGDGTSGPSYQFPNEGLPRPVLGIVSPAPDPSASPGADPNSYYIKGSIVMSNVDFNATGSQFMFVYRDGTALPAEYTEVGRVISGLEIIEQVAAAGAVDTAGAAAAVGRPSRDLTITSVQLVQPPATSPTPPASPGSVTPTATS
jgi:peptidyl-prolyl cis-trans isomerase B (cyclophilin B)